MAAIERQAAVPSAFVRAEPHARATPLGQLLFGERFHAMDERDGCWQGVAVRDGCAGWVRADALAEPTAPTHRVRSLWATPLGDGSSSAGAESYPLNALITVVAEEPGRRHDPRAGWIATADLAPIGAAFAEDAADVALRFLDAPYRDGAREASGLDAVGLVQQAFYACGLGCPRDPGLIARLGSAAEAPARGDLAVWPEHVALLIDAERLVHADPLHGAVRIDALSELAASLGGRPAFRRP